MTSIATVRVFICEGLYGRRSDDECGEGVMFVVGGKGTEDGEVGNVFGVEGEGGLFIRGFWVSK